MYSRANNMIYRSSMVLVSLYGINIPFSQSNQFFDKKPKDEPTSIKPDIKQSQVSKKSRKRIISHFATKGNRPRMEDFHVVCPQERVFAVFDGHGGDKVSKYLYDNILSYFNTFLQSFKPSESFKKSFKKANDEILANPAFQFQGSCAVGIFLSENSLVSVNIGDSRAVLSRNGVAYDLTVDHKPNAPNERERVEALGGRVSWDGLTGPDRQPVPGMGAYRINNCLAVSRALGDLHEKPFVSSEADIKKYELTEEDEFCILASDGLWDVLSSQECVHFVGQILSGHVGALEDGGGAKQGRKVERRLNQWTKEFDEDSEVVRAVLDNRKERMAQYLVEESLRRGTEDNVTVIVIWF
eukprot:maker-scaffold_9-snap-gene-7.25-mRNA-1 protein AED:0.05 eAED:0.05 QI:55/1/1/1/1/1/7/31/354